MSEIKQGLIEQYNNLKDTLTELEKKRVRQIIGLEPPDFIAWVQSEFYIPETNSPMSLHWLQKAALAEAMRTDDEGKFIYATVMWGDIKKSAKTAIGAARALWTAVHVPYAQVRVVGNDLKQAKSRLYEYISRCIELNKRLTEESGAREVGNRIEFANHSYIEAIAVDPKGEAGGGDDVVVFTELWGASTQAHVKLWSELTLSPLKYGWSQRWCESYAGVRGQSPLLEMIYDRCVVEKPEDKENKLGGKRIEKIVINDKGEEVKAPFYTDDTGNIFCLWNREPHLPWQTEAYYDNERATNPDDEFIRIHRNTFIESQQRYIDENTLRSCFGQPKPLTRRTVMVLASDAAYANNHYGLVGVTYDAEKDLVELVYEQEWIAPKGREVDLSQPEKVVRRLHEKHIVLVWAYDPYQLKRTAQSLGSNELGDPIETYEFNQQGKRSIADKALLDRMSTADIILPSDSRTVEHLRNADMMVIDERRVRIVRRQGSTGGAVDLAVSLSMATYVAVSERDKFPPPVTFSSDAGGAIRRFMPDENKEDITLPNDRMDRLPLEVYERPTRT